MIEGENEDKIDYKEKDIVWAKVKGYPWWPSIINNISFNNIQRNGENIKEKLYSIEFIGEKNVIKLPKEKIEPFTKNYEQHTNTNNTSLLKSIELAKKIYDKKQNTKIIFLKENPQDKNNKKDKDINISNVNNVINQNLATKKSHDSGDEKSKGDKENEKNIKFLQKKRINEHVILDDNDEMNEDDENNDINNSIDNQNKEDKKIISSPKNNIKINININLTTNNQNMVNINSFHSSNVLSQNNSNNIIPNTSFNPINISSLSGNENNINNNKTNNSSLNQIISLDKENIINSIDKNKKKEESIKNAKSEEKEEKNNINNNSAESNEEENESEEENENDEMIITNDEINEIIKKLLNCQIQISNISSQKTIITELIQLSEKLNELFAKNQELEIYSLTKDLIPILITFTYNKNNDILVKASEILSFLNEKIINEIFMLSLKEKKNLIDSLNNEKEKDKEKDKDKEINQNEIDENDYKEGLNIIEMINQKNLSKSNISDNPHMSFSKRGRPKKNSINSEISSEFLSSKTEGIFNIKDNNNINENNVYEDFIKIITCKDKEKMENDFKELSNNFFNNIYDKNNNDLDADMAKVRKQTCVKIFKLVHQVYPEINKDFLKKVIVYFEYKIRNDNSNLDKLYSNKINSLFEITKEKLYDKTK